MNPNKDGKEDEASLRATAAAALTEVEAVPDPVQPGQVPYPYPGPSSVAAAPVQLRQVPYRYPSPSSMATTPSQPRQGPYRYPGLSSVAEAPVQPGQVPYRYIGLSSILAAPVQPRQVPDPDPGPSSVAAAPVQPGQVPYPDPGPSSVAAQPAEVPHPDPGPSSTTANTATGGGGTSRFQGGWSNRGKAKKAAEVPDPDPGPSSAAANTATGGVGTVRSQANRGKAKKAAEVPDPDPGPSSAAANTATGGVGTVRSQANRGKAKKAAEVPDPDPGPSSAAANTATGGVGTVRSRGGWVNRGKAKKAAGQCVDCAEGKPEAVALIYSLSTGVNLYASSCHAQSQPIHGPGGIMNQASGQQLRSISSWNSTAAYTRIRITERDDIESLYPIIAAYVNEPSLADSVTEVVVDSDHWPSHRRCYLVADDMNKELREPPLPVRDDAHAAIEQYIRDLGLGEKATSDMLRVFEWKKKHLKAEGPDVPHGFNLHNQEFGLAAAAVLLSLCNNVTTLYIGGVGWHSQLKDYLLKANYGLLSRPGLQKLKHIEIITGSSRFDDERVYTRLEFLQYFQYFHRLPAIHSVFMEGVQEYQAEKHLFVPQTSNIKRIHIGHADIPSDMLGTIIRIPKGLEELTISLGGLWSTDGGTSIIFLKTLNLSIALHGGDYTYDREDGKAADGTPDYDQDRGELYEEESDEYFRLDEAISNSPLWSAELPDTQRYGHTIGSLHPFTAMTHLTMNMAALMGGSKQWQPPFRLSEEPPFRLIDTLPPNLEYLCLTGYAKGSNEDIDRHVEEFMEKKAERLPLLKEIKGIDEMVEELGDKYSGEDAEEDLWEKPQKKFSWADLNPGSGP
ncbi:hypothetical protein AK830_g5427 [Neonectria ditissima]|uniref:Uncharacterized protein n=1 Tax=Neonectria ditissima TaxID=78410 RepID=A0A0P7ATE5_9HYPO|nr:hypothetical protein AK830_g5427 [Neonectria ditissima]